MKTTRRPQLIRGSKETGTAVLDTISHTAHVAVRDTAEVGGDVEAAATGLVSGAIEGAKELGVSAEKAAAAAADGALKAAGTIAVILILLWLLGFPTSFTMGGVIHVLLVIALVPVVLRLLDSIATDYVNRTNPPPLRPLPPSERQQIKPTKPLPSPKASQK